MILIGYILWLALAVYIGRSVMRKVNRGRGAKLTSAWGVGMLFALLPVWDIVLGLPFTIDACRNRAGLQVYEEVPLPLSSVVIDSEIAPIAGCGDCMEIVSRGLATQAQVELAARAQTGEADPGTWVSRPGPTTYSISSRGDPRCTGFFESRTEREPHAGTSQVFQGIAFDDNTCIAAQSVERIVAEYRVTTRRVVEQHGVVTLQVLEAVLTSAHDQRPLASIARIYQSSWLSRMLFGNSSGVPDCPMDEEFEDGTRARVISARSLLMRMSARQRVQGTQP